MNSAAARKAQFRRELRAARNALLPATARRAAQRAALKLLRLIPRGAHVGVYLAIGSELDCAPLIRALHRAGAVLYVPCVDARSGARMHMVRLDPRAPLRRRRFGIREPVDRRRYAARLDVLVLPLLGFDSRGTRLGSGAGYYDRWVARQRPRPWCVGYALALQECAALPREPWDSALDAVCTEHGLRRCSRR